MANTKRTMTIELTGDDIEDASTLVIHGSREDALRSLKALANRRRELLDQVKSLTESLTAEANDLRSQHDTLLDTRNQRRPDMLDVARLRKVRETKAADGTVTTEDVPDDESPEAPAPSA